jgi:uncharacterized radical SAM superfamily Fe-S cluster-containing enzyme
MEEYIRLPMLNLCPTMRCNLKCKLCGVLVPHYDYRPHMTTQEFSDTLKAVFEIVDHVGKLQITGGEPLLHKELDVMIAECFKHDEQFDKLWLFVNCSVPFSAGTLSVLAGHKEKVLVHCSDYGVNLKASELIVKTLSENGIDYRYNKYFGDYQYFDGWVDQGDFEAHNRSTQELEVVFENCSHVKRGGSWYVRGGQMHWCGRSVRGMEVGKIPLCATDYLDIFDDTIAVRRDKLRTLMGAKSIRACDYCNGLYGTKDVCLRQRAGEQME